jgi:hypothetical protein
MSILNLAEFKILFPIRTLFLQWSWTIADFDPANGTIVAESSQVHVTLIFALSH